MSIQNYSELSLNNENKSLLSNSKERNESKIMEKLHIFGNILKSCLHKITNSTNLSGIKFVSETMTILTSEYLKYKILKKNNFNNTIKNLANRLANKNIFFIKIFQGLSNSAALDKELFTFFTKYTDNVEYSNDEIDFDELKNLENIARKNGHELKIDIDKPLNSGIIALVYTGILDGQKVIIKYLRKNISKKLIKSINDMEYLITILKYAPYLKDLNLYDLFHENREILLDQLSFTKEVNNIITFQKKFNTFPNIVIPNVYSYFTEENNNAIVMEFIEGHRLEEIENEDKDIYSKILCKFNVKAIYFDSIYHADLHSGNILFIKKPISTESEKSTESENNYKLSIGIIDYGIIGRLTREQQNTFFLFFKKVRERNYNNLSLYIIENLSEYSDDSGREINLDSKDKNDLCEKIEKICEKGLCDETKLFGGEEIFEINKALKIYNLKLARFFCKVELSMAIGENVCAALTYKTTYIQHLMNIFDEYFNIDNEF